MFISLKSHILKSEKGASSIIFALAFTFIIGMAAITIDIGQAMFEKSRLSTAVDSAALAGAQELISNSDNAVYMAESYIQKNLGAIKQVEVKVTGSEKTVEVKGVKTVNHFFARIFGIIEQDITAVAKARTGNIKSMSGVKPFAQFDQELIFGQQYTLKVSAGEGEVGNFNAISLGGTGTSSFLENLKNGYPGKINIYHGDEKDIIWTEPGVTVPPKLDDLINEMVSGCNHSPPCTIDYYNPDCPRIITIPIVVLAGEALNGRSPLKVVGFATFFLEACKFKGQYTDVTGRFMKYNVQGEISGEFAEDYGTYGIQLIK